MAYLNHSDSRTHRTYWSQARILDEVPGACRSFLCPTLSLHRTR